MHGAELYCIESVLRFRAPHSTRRRIWMLRNALRPGRYRAHPDACCAPNLYVKHRCRCHCADLHISAMKFVSVHRIPRGAKSGCSETRCVQVGTALILTRAVHLICYSITVQLEELYTLFHEYLYTLFHEYTFHIESMSMINNLCL